MTWASYRFEPPQPNPSILAARGERLAFGHLSHEDSPVPSCGSHLLPPDGAKQHIDTCPFCPFNPSTSRQLRAPSSMEASALSSSTLLCSSPLGRRPRRSLNHASGRLLLVPRSSADCSLVWLSSSSIRLSSSQRIDVVAPSAVSGSADVETSAISKDAADLLDEVEVFDLNGNAVPVSDLWKDRKAVVAFARHFGCVLCRKRADYLASKKDRMDASGVALVLIGPGSIDQAKAFAEQTKFEGEVYADPNHSSYDALRFAYGVSTIFTPGAGLKVMQSYMEGYRQDWKLSFEKHTVSKGGWQQGGIIVAGPGKKNISYIHRDKEAGDNPDIEEVLSACCS